MATIFRYLLFSGVLLAKIFLLFLPPFFEIRELERLGFDENRGRKERRRGDERKELHGKLIGLGRNGEEEENKNCFHPCFRIYLKTFE